MTKAETLLAAVTGPLEFTRGPYIAYVTGVRVPFDKPNFISAHVRITHDGVVKYDGYCNAGNPPLFYPDPNGSIQTGGSVEVDLEGNTLLDENGDPILSPIVMLGNDPLSALENIIFDAISDKLQ